MAYMASEPSLKPGRAGLMLMMMIVAVLVLCVAAVALPHNRYIRYQQFSSGDLSRIRWDYERLHFDKTPIDVAIIGTSRLEAAISAPKLAEALSKSLGQSVHVANLAIPAAGRDTHYALAQELFNTHPEVRMILLDLQAPIKRSHPAFRDIGDPMDVLKSPIFMNYYWLDNVTRLPYRNLSLFFDSMFAKNFGFDRGFNKKYYSKYGGTAFDTTEPFRLDNGVLVDREGFADLSKLESEAAAPVSTKQSILARLLGLDENIIERQANRKLAQQMGTRCGRLVFVHMPTYKERPGVVDFAANAPLAPILTPPLNVDDPANFADYAHLRRKGIDQVSVWLPQVLAPYLSPLTRCRPCLSKAPC